MSNRNRWHGWGRRCLWFWAAMVVTMSLTVLTMPRPLAEIHIVALRTRDTEIWRFIWFMKSTDFVNSFDEILFWQILNWNLKIFSILVFIRMKKSRGYCDEFGILTALALIYFSRGYNFAHSCAYIAVGKKFSTSKPKKHNQEHAVAALFWGVWNTWNRDQNVGSHLNHKFRWENPPLCRLALPHTRADTDTIPAHNHTTKTDKHPHTRNINGPNTVSRSDPLWWGSSE